MKGDANVKLQGLLNPVSLIANLTDVVLPDGVATLPFDPSVVLVADAAKGVYLARQHSYWRSYCGNR
jgi:hypothetical protein